MSGVRFFCPGKEAAMWIIVSAAADPLYVIPMWIFDCVVSAVLGLHLLKSCKLYIPCVVLPAVPAGTNDHQFIAVGNQ